MTMNKAVCLVIAARVTAAAKEPCTTPRLLLAFQKLLEARFQELLKLLLINLLA